jgi:hypothetical protein
MSFAELNGTFDGIHLHSKQYKCPAQLEDQRVLVIGSGNSAADIACEAARIGTSSVLSMRDSPWIFPKSFMGVPLGRIKLKKLPPFLDRFLVRLLIKLSFGSHALYRLPAPRHKPFEKHPTVSEELPYYLRHGRILTKPEIERVAGKTVWFKDGTALEFDVIVSATGFHLSFPFLPETLVRKEGKALQCLGFCVYQDYKGLFFVGWPQVRGGIGSLASAFSKAVVNLIRLEEEIDAPAGQVLAAMGNKACSTHLYAAKEIFTWIERHSYAKLISAYRRYGNRIDRRPNQPTALRLERLEEIRRTDQG